VTNRSNNQQTSRDLASTIAFYNIHLLLHNPKEKPLTVTVGGLQYTGNVELLKRHYLLKENNWKKSSPISIEEIGDISFH
jgi:hypothetical protein